MRYSCASAMQASRTGGCMPSGKCSSPRQCCDLLYLFIYLAGSSEMSMACTASSGYWHVAAFTLFSILHRSGWRRRGPAAGHGVPSLATGCGWSVSLHCATAPWLAHVAACDADYCSGGCLSSRPAASAPSLHLSERQPAGPSLAEDQGAASRCEMQALRACWSRCTTPADFAPMRVAWVKGVIALAGFCVRSRMDMNPTT